MGCVLSFVVVLEPLAAFVPSKLLHLQGNICKLTRKGRIVVQDFTTSLHNQEFPPSEQD